MQIRVQCQCGQTYEFEVEPVNGVMPCGVNCPACGADGTALSNAFIAQNSPAPAAPAPPPPAAPGLRVRRHEPAAEAPVAADAPAPPPLPPARPPYRQFQPEAAAAKSDANIPLGILGGVVAGALGAAGWYFLTMATDRHFGLVAWFIGVMTGVGVRVLGKGGTPAMGAIAALCAILAIAGGDFLVANTIVNKISGDFGGTPDSMYEEQMKEAKEVVKLQTDDEIKAWIEKNDEPDGPVTAKDIAKFRSDTVPKMQDFVNGKPSKEEFVKTAKTPAEALTSFRFKFTVFLTSFSLFTLLFMVFGVMSAYRIGSQ